MNFSFWLCAGANLRAKAMEFRCSVGIGDSGNKCGQRLQSIMLQRIIVELPMGRKQSVRDWFYGYSLVQQRSALTITNLVESAQRTHHVCPFLWVG
jgi:hypothetical protein